MSISIIIATIDRHELLKLLLASLEKSRISKFEVIIVDQSKKLFSLDKVYDLLIKNYMSNNIKNIDYNYNKIYN